MSAAATARSIRREDTSPAGRPLDKVQALQWTLYRCAKQDPERRFHALYGHVHRMDVLWRAWSGGGTNPGGPRGGGGSLHRVGGPRGGAVLPDPSGPARGENPPPGAPRRGGGRPQ